MKGSVNSNFGNQSNTGKCLGSKFGNKAPMKRHEIVITMEVIELQELIQEAVRTEFQNYRPIQSNVPDIITSKEAVDFLKVPKITFHKWINDGRIICYHLGSRMYFKKSELEAAITGKVI